MKRFLGGVCLGLLLGTGLGAAVTTALSPGPVPAPPPPPEVSEPDAAPATVRTERRAPRVPARRTTAPGPGARAAGRRPSAAATVDDSHPKPGDYPGQTAAQLLARLERVAAGLSREDADLLVLGIAKKDSDREVPVGLTLRLMARSASRFDTSRRGAERAVLTWSGQAVRDGLRRALETDAEGSAPYAELSSAMVLRLQEIGKPTALDAESLLKSANPLVRRAGVLLGGSLWPFPLELVAPLARADPDDQTRADALVTLLHIGLGGNADVLQAARGIAIDAARNGGPATRREAIWNLPELGPAAADTALSLLGEAALPSEERNAAVETVVAAGRADALLRRPSREILAGVAHYLVQADELSEDTARLLAPHLAEIVAAAPDTEDAAAVFVTLCEAGSGDAVAAYAADRSHPAALRGSAIEQMLDIESTKERGVELARELLARGESAALRRSVVESLEYAFYDASEKQKRATRELLESILKDDPDFWVRAAAHDVLEMLRLSNQ